MKRTKFCNEERNNSFVCPLFWKALRHIYRKFDEGGMQAEKEILPSLSPHQVFGKYNLSIK